MHVFLTGATGLIGRALAARLLADGHAVTGLTRRRAGAALPAGVAPFEGDPARPGRWQEVLARCDACVHLAGEPVAAGRWTAARKARIESSRVDSTRLVAEVIAAGGPSILVAGSATGYYGSRGDEPLDESAAPGAGFLAGVTRRWEAAAAPAARRARVVNVRTGLVLAREGGALPRLVLPFRLFAGGPLGDGGAWQPWIHLEDEVGLLRMALLDGRASGPLNAAAPEPATSRDLARAIGAALRRPAFVPAPAFALRLALGELAEAVLSSEKVVPRKALDLGYAFRFPSLAPALRALL
ncbi:MAG TPA: TIGR01777 family oxidoreductase [Anaeromyxobacteraceae bacterium]|nr:TIGR01777 family oxidoreductase [Anaeromyxobacteraceae bacterium]